MGVEDLPHLNAFLNATSFIFLVQGYRAVKRRQFALHARLMAIAFGVSTAFLASYLTYHFTAAPIRYGGAGLLRTVYFSILISHIVLAALTVPLAVTTLLLALRGRLASHRRLARWTFPIWSYVSVTGVIVYLMVYVFPPV